MGVLVRIADLDDLHDLVHMAAYFTAESAWGVTFNAEKARAHLRLYLMTPGFDVLIAKDGGKLVGGAMVAVAHEFQKQPFGYVGKFYLMPEARSMTIANLLINAMKEWFAAYDVSHIFVTATAGLTEREQRAFILLMKRAKFKESGPVMWLKM